MKNIKKYKYLDNIDTKNLKLLNIDELNFLSEEIRDFLIFNISKTGGHLASNLGVVELTLALHKVFDFDCDKIIWDVGHQCYTHKILTGRKDKFHTLRQFNGISGFPKIEESKYDFFNTGHSGTSISAAIGFSEAAKIQSIKCNIIAVIGDAAICEGMAFEAINHLGESKNHVIIILNDNGMSISKSVGALSICLNNIRNSQLYFKIKKDVKVTLKKFPFGNNLIEFINKIKGPLKHAFVNQKIFEDFGIHYTGPVDGHDIKKLITALNNVKKIDGPVLLHVHTKKGKGYKLSEENPELFHSIPKFCVETGKIISPNKINKSLNYDNIEIKNYDESFSEVFGKTITKLASENTKIAAITAAMPKATGLHEFSLKFKERFFDVGICEAHSVTFAAGLSKMGLVPVLAVYSSFLQRGYDQILHDVALQNLHVIFAIDRSGIVGSDGETHHGLYDISFLLSMPNTEILAPATKTDLKNFLKYSLKVNNPIFIRYPKAKVIDIKILEKEKKLKENFNKIIITKKFKIGPIVALLSVGTTFLEGMIAFDILVKKGVSVALFSITKLKPISKEFCLQISKNYDIISVIEDGNAIGGFGSFLEGKIGKKIIKFSYPNEKICHGSNNDLKQKYCTSGEKIAEKLISILF